MEAVSSKHFGFGMVLNDNDRELIEACQRGEQDAFALLFEANRDRIQNPNLIVAGRTYIVPGAAPASSGTASQSSQSSSQQPAPAP